MGSAPVPRAGTSSVLSATCQGTRIIMRRPLSKTESQHMGQVVTGEVTETNLHRKKGSVDVS